MPDSKQSLKVHLYYSVPNKSRSHVCFPPSGWPFLGLFPSALRVRARVAGQGALRAASLSGSWCCQESLLLECTDLLAAPAEQRSAVSLPTCQPCPGAAEKCALFSLQRLQQGAPSLTLPSSVPEASLLALRHTHFPTLSSREGISPINLWTNVKAAGEGHLSSAEPQTANKARHVLVLLSTWGSWSSCQHNGSGSF